MCGSVDSGVCPLEVPRAVGGSAVGRNRPILRRTSTRAPLRKIVLGPGSLRHELMATEEVPGVPAWQLRALSRSRHSPGPGGWAVKFPSWFTPWCRYRDEPKGLGEPGSLGSHLAATPTHFPTGRPRRPGCRVAIRPRPHPQQKCLHSPHRNNIKRGGGGGGRVGQQQVQG